ncbi:MAG: hypothetical protein WAL29_03065 [Bacteroidales bacterium]
MKKFTLTLFFMIFMIISCSENGIEVDSSNLLLGRWNYTDYQEDISFYERTSEFTDTHGFQFNSDGTLIERKINGFCGTPPVTYADYQGNWTILNDTLIEVNAGYWGGTTNYWLDIESVSENSLKVQFIYVN